MKKIFYNGLILSIFCYSCYTEGESNGNFQKLSPKIEHVISDYIKESEYENDSNKLILVFINNNFRETKIIITACNTRMYRDTSLFSYGNIFTHFTCMLLYHPKQAPLQCTSPNSDTLWKASLATSEVRAGGKEKSAKSLPFCVPSDLIFTTVGR